MQWQDGVFPSPFSSESLGETGYGKVRGQTFTLRAPLNCIARASNDLGLGRRAIQCLTVPVSVPLRYASLGR
jgi:hypothetical protein